MGSDIPISKLAHDIAQITYKELHALLDSMTELESMERRERLCDFAASTRHRLMRLLVAVRWHMEYSSYHLFAGSLSNIAVSRSTNYTATADNLFGVRQLSLGAAGQPSATAYAAEVLGDGLSSFRLPRIIESAADVDTLVQKDDEMPKMRLQRETRHAVRVGLPSGVAIIDWGVAPDGFAVRVGIPNVWQADVLLDASNPSVANFRLHDFKILMRGHIDACGPISRITPVEEEPMSMMKDHFSRLCALMEDRMSWAAAEVADNGPKARAEASLHCMCMILSREICTGLVLRYVRQQVKPLAVHQAWRKSKLIVHGLGSKAGALVPVSIEYWKQSPYAAKITIGIPDEDGYRESDISAAKGRPQEIVCITHVPELPVAEGDVKLDMARINVESLLLAAARRRSQHILALINDKCKAKNAFITGSVLAAHGASTESLIFDIGETGYGLQLCMSLRTGAFRVDLRGGTNLALRYRLPAAESLKRAVWKGEMHFKDGIQDIERAMLKIIDLLVQLLKIATVHIHTAIADELTLLTWPPGTASVECPGSEKIEKHNIRPPLICVERSAPRKFLAANSWLASTDDSALIGVEPAKRSRKTPVFFQNTSDTLVFIQGKEPHGLPPEKDATDLSYYASIGARYSELRHSNEMRFRRDYLLREFAIYKAGNALNADSEMRNSSRSPINLTSAGQLPMTRAHLVLSDLDKWRVEVELNADIFDTEKVSFAALSMGPHYIGGIKQLLIFAYKGNPRVVPTFMFDLKCACKIAHVSRVIASQKTAISVVSRSPRQITIRAYGLTNIIRWNLKGYNTSLTFTEDRTGIKYCAIFGHLFDEVFDDLLRDSEQSAMMHLKQTMAVIASLEKVCSHSWIGTPKFRFSTRIYLPFTASSKLCAVDIDIRNLRPGFITLTDYGRLLKLRAASGRSSRDGTNPNTGNVLATGSRTFSGGSSRIGSAAASSAGERSSGATSRDGSVITSAPGVAAPPAPGTKAGKGSPASRQMQSSGRGGPRSEGAASAPIRRVSGGSPNAPSPIALWDVVASRIEEQKVGELSNNKFSIIIPATILGYVLSLLSGQSRKGTSRPESTQ